MKKLNSYKGDIYLKISGQLSLNSFYDVHIIIWPALKMKSVLAFK